MLTRLLAANRGDGTSNGQAMVALKNTTLAYPKTLCLGGARDANEMENFLIDMEQYFKAYTIKRC